MTFQCPNCKQNVNKLVTLDDADTTAMISSQQNIPLPEYYSVCPSCALKILGINQDDLLISEVPLSDEVELISEIETQRQLMISVSTGGPRIQEKNKEYQRRRRTIRAALKRQGISDPNPYSDLWDWYGKWSSGDLPTNLGDNTFPIYTNLY